MAVFPFQTSPVVVCGTGKFKVAPGPETEDLRLSVAGLVWTSKFSLKKGSDRGLGSQ